MDKEIFIHFLKAAPPFYGCITKKLLEEIKLHKDIRASLLREFDSYLALKDDKASWFKYLSSMPSDSKNSKGEYRLIKYFKTFPHCKVDKKTLEEAIKIKNAHFLIQFLKLVPKTLDAKEKYYLGKCLSENNSVKEGLFQEVSKEMKSYFLDCLLAYSKFNEQLPVPEFFLTKNDDVKLLEAPKKKKQAKGIKFTIKRSHLDNARSKKRGSSSKIPFVEQTDELWNYLCEQSSSHPYTQLENVFSRFGDILAYEHNHNIITVNDNKNEIQIHANKVSLEKDTFIIAQYPANHMTGQFLRCILQNESRLIIDFTQERDIKNLHKYYECGEYDGVRVKILEGDKNMPCGFTIKVVECFDSKDLKTDAGIFYHLRFDGWRNHEPLSLKKIAPLLEFVQKWINQKGGKSFPIVHSSEGVGRAAIFLCALHILKMIQEKKVKTEKEALKCVADSIWSLRVQRGPDCVQTYAQVNMLIQIALNALEKDQ